MDHFERFRATIERRPVDRPASWLGLPLAEAERRLCARLNAANLDRVREILDDDLYPVELPYHSPTSNAIYAAFNFACKDRYLPDERTLTAPGFFRDFSDPGGVESFEWPDPSRYIDPLECRRMVDRVPEGYPALGVVWSAHFQDACAAFGMETALVKMLTEPEMFRAVIDRIVRFYLVANEIFYRATRGKLSAVLIGNDFGCQRGLMLSRECIRAFALPGTRLLVEQAKSHGLKVIHHSCGSVFDIIPDLIECGVDAIHPIQALAKDMEAAHLKEHFGGRISFCGGVDAQYLLVEGTPEQIKKKVRELKSLFPTGLIVSPSHEAILPDVDPENVIALFEALHE
jgi:uroporphyrinogen decarboxylase